MSNHQFKKGDKALLEVEVMFQEPPSEMTSNKTLYQVKLPYPFRDCHTCFVDAPILHPAPREGEADQIPAPSKLDGQPINGLEVGDEVMHRAKILGFYDDGKHVRLESDGWEYSYNANLVSPAPREGEYRLTKGELLALLNNFSPSAYTARLWTTRTPEVWLNQWLANRKKEA